MPRSGSNLLCGKMRTTGVLGYPTEYFRHWDTPEMASAERCVIAATKGRTPNGVVAFKLFPEHFDRLQAEIRLTEWFPDPVWVLLERRDLLGQAISLARAMQDGKWSSTGTATGVAEYSREQIEASLRKIVVGNARWASFFARAGIEPLRFVYEDIDGDFDSVCRAIAARLGLDEPMPPTTDVSIKPQRDVLNDEWRARFVAETGPLDDLPELTRHGGRGRRQSRWKFWKG